MLPGIESVYIFVESGVSMRSGLPGTWIYSSGPGVMPEQSTLVGGGGMGVYDGVGARVGVEGRVGVYVLGLTATMAFCVWVERVYVAVGVALFCSVWEYSAIKIKAEIINKQIEIILSNHTKRLG